MARLHSRKKGKSGTKRPKTMVAPEWVSQDKAAISEIILKMANEGATPARIGLYLRDQMGIANIRVILGKPLATFIREEGAATEYPEDLLNLMRKAARMGSHLKGGNKDVHNAVKLKHVESKIQRLVRYYSSKGRIPKGWKYTAEQAALVAK